MQERDVREELVTMRSKENRPVRRQASLSVKRCIIFAKKSMALNRRSRQLPLGCLRRDVLA